MCSSDLFPSHDMAGRGKLSYNKKGGYLKIKVEEPSYIIGIVSITPRIDYSQGTKWDRNLKTMNDLRKPALDGIGFQPLITPQMSWFDSTASEGGGAQIYSAGKQPAWINYMTDVDTCHGDFADEKKAGYMVLKRNYEDRKSTRLNSSHITRSRMPSSA